MNLPNTPNYNILNNKPSDPAGYVTKDGKWAAVPWGSEVLPSSHPSVSVS